MNRSGIFITATDTGVGKTWLACRLIPLIQTQLQTLSLPLRVRKPVESGCQFRNNCLFPEDASTLLAAAGYNEKLEQVCRYRLQSTASPARAAKLENIPLQISDLLAACITDTEAFLLVEGAGGFYSPLARDGLNADFATQLELPLLVVCPDQLGCIGQTLLLLEAAQRRGLQVIAVVINQASLPTEPPPDYPALDNVAELSSHTNVPIFKTYHSAGRQYCTDNPQSLQGLAQHVMDMPPQSL